MDLARSWEREFETTLLPLKSNWIVQTDGGRRSHGVAASSLIVGIWAKVGGQFRYEPWFAKGILLNGEVDVFQTEAIALDQAVQWTMQRLRALKGV